MLLLHISDGISRTAIRNRKTANYWDAVTEKSTLQSTDLHLFLLPVFWTVPNYLYIIFCPIILPIFSLPICYLFSFSPEEATAPLLPHLVEHILRLPKPFTPPSYIIKALWLVFAVTIKPPIFYYLNLNLLILIFSFSFLLFFLLFLFRFFPFLAIISIH